MQKSTFSDYMDRLPKGADVAVTSGHFYFSGQILNYDQKHLIISDGESLQLVRIGAIDDINYCLPDGPLEIVEMRQ